MTKSFRRFLTYSIACIFVGIGLGIAIMVLQQRTGVHVGGEFLVLLAIPAAVAVGMQLGARLVTMPVDLDKKPAKVWVPYWR